MKTAKEIYDKLERSKPIHPSLEKFYINEGEEDTQHLGMTLREHYVGLAMQGILASCSGMEDWMPTRTVTQKSLAFADALIAELNKEP